MQIFVVARRCNIHWRLHNLSHSVQRLHNHDNNEFLSFSSFGDVFRPDGCVTGSSCSCPSRSLYTRSNPGVVRYEDDFFFQCDTKLSGIFSFHLARVHLCLFTQINFLVGGWSILDPKDAEAKKAGRYAVSTTYPSGKTTMRVVSAKCQIVSGWNYDLNVAVTFIGNRSCSMQNYVVWKVGDPNAPSPYKVTKQTALTSQKCKSK